MIYIKHDYKDPSFNFAIEEYLMSEKDLGENSIFMFWRTLPTLMIGRFQNTIEEINQEYVRQNNLNVVRRNSGGGTIYTDEGTWQFSFIIKNYEHNEVSFEHFTKPIIKALKKLGANAEFNSRNDLIINGKKFSGNAQYRKKNAMVHHGSILYKTNLENLVKSISVSDDKIISKGIKSVRERVTNVSEHLQSPPSVEEFRDIMVKSIMEESDKIYLLTDMDLSRIQEISENKFKTWQWNYGSSPQFDIERKNRFAGGEVKVKLKVTNGFIENCKISGDFFEVGSIEEVEKSLYNIKYNKKEIQEIIEKKELYTHFKSISKEELQYSIIE